MRLHFTLLALLLANASFSQKHTINGTVRDIASGELLPYANVYLDNGIGTSTNSYGYFSITTSLPQFTLNVSYIGYDNFKQDFNLTNDTLVDIQLLSDNQLDEVVVTDDAKQNRLRSSQFNVANINMTEVSQIPSLLGEHDVLKALQTMPGISGGGDGTSGVYVRGGSPDQNLMLLDGAVVYNANHLFGFLSVFNSEAIKSATVIKGGFPARYGGRLSSVIDLQMKEGNTKETKGMASVGLLSAQLALEGPIGEKTSYLLTARRAYFDLFLWATCKINEDEGKTSAGYYFYDVNAKINHRFDSKRQLFASFYSGSDKMHSDMEYEAASCDVDDNFKLGWHNQTATLRYNRTIGNKSFLNTSLIYSNYKYETDMSTYYKYVNTKTEFSRSNGNSGLKDMSAKMDLDWFPNPQHNVKTGLNFTFHVFSPEQSYHESGWSNITTSSADTIYGVKNVKSADFSLYAEDDWTILPSLKANLGIRLTSFMVQNKSYKSAEPRLSMCYLLSNNLSVKASYSLMTQYAHLVSNSSVGLPTDQWLPSTKIIKPESSNQISLGLQYNTEKYELTIEGFHKKMDNLLEFREGAEYQSFDKWESKLVSGKGNSYGMEIMAKKSKGKTCGWISYTLSWSKRTFDELNGGESFPFKYDRRHNFSIVGMYKFSKKYDISANWTISNGNRITVPVARVKTINGEDVVAYSKRNEYQMPVYHRLDVCANMNKAKKHGTATWTFGIYNLYARQNPLYIYAESDEKTHRLKQTSVLTIVPTITYTFRF